MNRPARITLFGMAFVLALAIALAAGKAFAQSKPDPMAACVSSYVAKYAALCETAEIAARGAAYACAPRPLPKNPAYEGDGSGAKSLAWDYALKESAHEQAFARALVGILDARSKQAPDCRSSRP